MQTAGKERQKDNAVNTDCEDKRKDRVKIATHQYFSFFGWQNQKKQKEGGPNPDGQRRI